MSAAVLRKEPEVQEATATVSARLAEKVCGVRREDLSASALHWARTCILDTIGVTLAGIPEPCTQILLRTPGVATAPGTSLVFGTDRRTSALDATLINGTASHALDFDDFSGALGGHHSVPLVPALFALAEDRGIGGEKLVTAYAAGVEAETRLARAVNFHHYDKGWHPTATLGTIGAAAAVAHLLDLGPAKTATALSIAASLASGIKANFGTMTKPLHVGQCGRNGLFAALLAEGGFEAAADAFEHHQGFFDVFNGPGTYDVDRLFADWGEPFEIDARSIGLKQFPCCGSTHPAIMMALALRDEEKVAAEDIEAITVLPHGRRLRHTNTPKPETSLEAKFSVQYVVARALTDGAVRLKDFEGEAHHEPEIRRLLDKTTARPHPDMPDDSPQQWGAEVSVRLKDGRTLSRRVEDMVGRGPDAPMSEAELWSKFEDCASRALPGDAIAPLFETLGKLDGVGNIGEVTRLLAIDPSANGKAP